MGRIYYRWDDCATEGIIYGALQAALPAALAVFPQVCSERFWKILEDSGVLCPLCSPVSAQSLHSLSAQLSIQTLTMDVSSLEPEFQQLVDSQGRPVRSLSGNKGL